MRTKARQAYIQGYFKGLQKSAGIGDVLSDSAEGGWSLAKGSLLLAPAVAGALGGAAISKLTSPVGKDRVIQKQILADQIEAAVADLERRKALAILKEQADVQTAKKARTLHF